MDLMPVPLAYVSYDGKIAKGEQPAFGLDSIGK
jgi:hypothetical protein